MVTSLGCSSSTAPASGKGLSFDPGLALMWPGTPTESSQIITTDLGELKDYSAMLTEKRPNGLRVFSAAVLEFPEKQVEGQSPRMLLAACVFASKKDETSRKDVEYGPRKYPGFAITTRRGKWWGRRLAVLAGRRFYDLSVTATSQALLRDGDVEVFFDSFHLGGENPD
jgi:hypothetical protein